MNPFQKNNLIQRISEIILQPEKVSEIPFESIPVISAHLLSIQSLLTNRQLSAPTPPAGEEEEYWTMEEAAQFLRSNIDEVGRRGRTGDLKKCRLKIGGKVLFSKEKLKKHMRDHIGG